MQALARLVERLITGRESSSRLRRSLDELSAEVAQRQRSETRLGAVLAASPAGIFLTDPAGACQYVNPAWERMAGMHLERAQGWGWAEAIHPQDRASVSERWRQSCEQGSPFSSCHRFLHADGRVEFRTDPEWFTDYSRRTTVEWDAPEGVAQAAE